MPAPRSTLVVSGASFAALVLLSTIATTAHANGRFPAALQLAVDPSDESHLAVRATFGVLESHDGGHRWDWICEQAITPAGFADPPLAIAGDGTLLIGLADGVRITFGDSCHWQNAQGDVAGVQIADIAVDRGTPSRVYTLHWDTVDGGTYGVVAKSEDNGATFVRVGPGEPDFFPY